MRFIDADIFMNELNESQREFDEYYKGLGKAKTLLLSQPTIDAEPVRHEHWIEMKRAHYFKCSKCRNPIPYKFGWKLYNGVIHNKRYYNYCPNCGAKMDEVPTNG